MKKTYEINVEEVTENILLEVNRYVSNIKGYRRDLLEHNIKEIIEKGCKSLPSTFNE